MPAPQLEGVDLYLVAEGFPETTHGQLGCIACHEGNNVGDKEEAHAGMTTKPSYNTTGICADCHGDTTDSFANSLHYTMAGFTEFLEGIAHPGAREDGSGVQAAFDGNCAKCHSTCGTCHVTRPKAYGGGLHTQHMFEKSPPVDQTCYGCHGARSAGEFIGDVGYVADTHYQSGMTCSDCHPASNFHGTGEVETNMKDHPDRPQCIDCHENQIGGNSGVMAHDIHPDDMMSCQVCHASASNSCFGCHTEVKSDGSVDGISETRLTFKIGKNPKPTEQHPYEYIAVRHIPTTESMFDSLEEGLLQNFDQYYNWKYASTHNIQRITGQNESCDSCHGNQYIFINEGDIRDYDSPANREVIVDPIPE